MSESTKTLGWAAAAVVALALAWWATPGDAEPELFSDAGEVFFPAFTDPGQVHTLEIAGFDEASAEALSFVVTRDDQGRWTIPSHEGYPADAKSRMAKAAALAIGLRKEAVRSDRARDHQALGVLDPLDSLDSADASLKGRGTKVTFRDASGGELASLILGRAVAEDDPERRFVRLPGRARVYVAAPDGELSARFGDWIESDLLQVSTWQIDRLHFDEYAVEERGFSAVIVEGEDVIVEKREGSWTMGDLPEGQEVDSAVVDAVTRTLDDLRIVGVRKKPEGLDASLAGAEGRERAMLEQVLAAELQARGYFLAQDGSIVSNEGDLIVRTNEGVRYTLRFGEVVYGDDDALSTAPPPPPAAEGRSTDPTPEGAAVVPVEGEAEGDAPEGRPNRYLMVAVAFDETALPEPDEAALKPEVLTKLRATRERLVSVEAALARWREANPTGAPADLAVLTKAPEGETPLLEGVSADAQGAPLDAYDHPFALVVEPPAEGAEEGTPPTLKVSFLGADGAEGGERENADAAGSAELDVVRWERLADEWSEHERKTKQGKELVAKLQARFGPWYYVIDASSYDDLKPGREKLLTEVTDEDAQPTDDFGG